MKLKSILCLLIIAGFCSMASGLEDKKAMKDLKTVEQNSKNATKARTQEGAKATAAKGVDTKGTYKAPVKLDQKATKSAAQVSKEGNAKKQADDLAKSKEMNKKNKAGAPPPLH